MSFILKNISPTYVYFAYELTAASWHPLSWALRQSWTCSCFLEHPWLQQGFAHVVSAKRPRFCYSVRLLGLLAFQWICNTFYFSWKYLFERLSIWKCSRGKSKVCWCFRAFLFLPQLAHNCGGDGITVEHQN